MKPWVFPVFISGLVREETALLPGVSEPY